MQQEMERVQTGLAARTVEATSGGGGVKVTARCDGTLAAIKIDDMILIAANQALAQAKEISSAEMGKVTSGFNLPGMV